MSKTSCSESLSHFGCRAIEWETVLCRRMSVGTLVSVGAVVLGGSPVFRPSVGEYMLSKVIETEGQDEREGRDNLRT